MEFIIKKNTHLKRKLLKFDLKIKKISCKLENKINRTFIISNNHGIRKLVGKNVVQKNRSPFLRKYYTIRIHRIAF
jgi:hypothetical protein